MASEQTRVGFRNLDQERARAAQRAVDDIKDKHPELQGRYRQYAERLPAMLISSGLGQTLAFLRSKSNGVSREARAYERLYADMQAWLVCGAPVTWLAPGGTPLTDPDVLKRIQGTTNATLSHATLEALAYAGWLKRLAQAYLKADERPNDADGA